MSVLFRHGEMQARATKPAQSVQEVMSKLKLKHAPHKDLEGGYVFLELEPLRLSLADKHPHITSLQSYKSFGMTMQQLYSGALWESHGSRLGVYFEPGMLNMYIGVLLTTPGATVPNPHVSDHAHTMDEHACMGDTHVWGIAVHEPSNAWSMNGQAG